MIALADFADEVDCGSFFDHIDDLLDFPADDIEACRPGADKNSFPSIWTTHSDSLPGSDSVFSHNHSASDLSAELALPYEDIVQLEWLSNFVEDSFSGGSLTMNIEETTFTNNDLSNQFRTSSPVSVLESGSSFSGDQKTAPRSPVMFAKRGRPRSKRPRPASFVPRLTMQLISPNFPTRIGSDSENCVESRLTIKLPKQVSPEHKKKKVKFTMPLSQAEINPASTPIQVRKCMHCEITKTPQWRAGPMGPKTLCNACGVRYKSGRLFPEYRPAASPTFVPTLHSNSHKKVVEMRNKVCETIRADSPQLIPNSSTLYM